MPRYFFNVVDGRSPPDSEGMELPDRAHAKAAAIRLSGELIRDMATSWSGSDWSLSVADSRGRMLFTFRFSAEEREAGDPV